MQTASNAKKYTYIKYFIFGCNIRRNGGGDDVMEYKRELKVLSKEIGSGERYHLNGKCSYRRVFDRFITNAVLCNNIVEVDPEIFYNQETGFCSYEELYEEKLQELKKEYKGMIVEKIGLTASEMQKGFKTLQELEQEAEQYADENQYDFEFYQYFIIDINYYDLEYLKKCNQKTLQIMYSEKLDCYILGVGHFGTSWDYVGNDFDLIEVMEG